MTKEELAFSEALSLPYIAGFLDGDGCVMLQLVYRHDYVLGYQIRASVVFYQKAVNASFLEWLKGKLKFGYTRIRKDDMCEYTIVGVEPVTEVLKLLSPYLVLKKKQAELALKVLAQMPEKGKRITQKLLLSLSYEVDKFADLNYSKRRTNTSKKLIEFLKSHNLLIP